MPSSAFSSEFFKKASIPIIETYVYSCQKCNWWAIREIFADCELSDGMGDYLITLKEKQPQTAAPASPNLSIWLAIIGDATYWQNSRGITLKTALHLFGRQETMSKRRSRQHSKHHLVI